MVAERVSADVVLERSGRAVRVASEVSDVAVIAAGSVRSAKAGRTNFGSAALHCSADDHIGCARKLRVTGFPQRMPVDLGGRALVGFRRGGQNGDSRG